MPNELGQPTVQEIAEKFCTEMLCNALVCAGCPVHEMIHGPRTPTCPGCGTPLEMQDSVWYCPAPIGSCEFSDNDWNAGARGTDAPTGRITA